MLILVASWRLRCCMGFELASALAESSGLAEPEPIGIDSLPSHGAWRNPQSAQPAIIEIGGCEGSARRSPQCL